LFGVQDSLKSKPFGFLDVTDVFNRHFEELIFGSLIENI